MDLWKKYGLARRGCHVVCWPGSAARGLQPSLAHGDPGDHDHGAEWFVPGQGLAQDGDAQPDTDDGGDVCDGGGVGGPPFTHHVGVPHVGQPGSHHTQGGDAEPDPPRQVHWCGGCKRRQQQHDRRTGANLNGGHRDCAQPAW